MDADHPSTGVNLPRRNTPGGIYVIIRFIARQRRVLHRGIKSGSGRLWVAKRPLLPTIRPCKPLGQAFRDVQC